MSDSTALEEHERGEANASKQRGIHSWTWTRILFCIYRIVVPIAVIVLTAALISSWRPSEEWQAFAARFVTSPGAGGMAAVVAAVIGATTLNRQLTHSKKKAAEEGWWQQFEWVTDRIITPANDAAALPPSLAFDLMNSLYSSAQAPFQNAAVDGIFRHYFNNFDPQAPLSEGSKALTLQGRVMDETVVKSLRNLLDTRPESSPSNAHARRVLETHEYGQEVLKALRHQGVAELDANLVGSDSRRRPDGLFTMDSKKFVIEVKANSPTASLINGASNQLKKYMSMAEVTHGFIIMPPPAAKWALEMAGQGAEGIHIVEWEPPMGSAELKRRIREVLS